MQAYKEGPLITEGDTARILAGLPTKPHKVLSNPELDKMIDQNLSRANDLLPDNNKMF